MHCRHHVCYIESCNEGRTHYIGRIPQSMPNEMKKRSVIERLKEKYIRVARSQRHRNEENVSLRLFIDDFPGNIEKAKSLEMQTILFIGIDDLKLKIDNLLKE